MEILLIRINTNAINYLLENKVKECFSILLHYYDKMYANALYKRENVEVLLNKIPCETVEAGNAQKLLFPGDLQNNSVIN